MIESFERNVSACSNALLPAALQRKRLLAIQMRFLNFTPHENNLKDIIDERFFNIHLNRKRKSISLYKTIWFLKFIPNRNLQNILNLNLIYLKFIILNLNVYRKVV